MHRQAFILSIVLAAPIVFSQVAPIGSSSNEADVWGAAERAKTNAALYREYLSAFPVGPRASIAKDCVAWAKAETAAQGNPWSDAFATYLADFPAGRFQERAFFYKGLVPQLRFPKPPKIVDDAIRDTLSALNRGGRQVTTGSGTYDLKVQLLTGQTSVSGGRLSPTGVCSVTAYDPIFGEDKFIVYARVTNGVYALRSSEQEPSAVLLPGARSAFWDLHAPAWSSHANPKAEQFVRWELRQGNWTLVVRPFFHSPPASPVRVESPDLTPPTIDDEALGKAMTSGMPRRTAELYKLVGHPYDLRLLGVALAYSSSGLRPDLTKDDKCGLFAMTQEQWTNTVDYMVTNGLLKQPLSYTHVLDPNSAAEVALAELNYRCELLKKQGILADKSQEDAQRLTLAAYYSGVNAVARARDVPAEARPFVDQVMTNFKRSDQLTRAGRSLEVVYGLPKSIPVRPRFTPYTNGVAIIESLRGVHSESLTQSRTLVIDKVQLRDQGAPDKPESSPAGRQNASFKVEKTPEGQVILYIDYSFLQRTNIGAELSKEWLGVMERFDVDRILFRGAQPTCYFIQDGKLDTKRFLLTAATGKTYRESGDYGARTISNGVFMIRVPYASPVRTPLKGSVSAMSLTASGWMIEIMGEGNTKVVLWDLGEVTVKRGALVSAGDLVGLAGQFVTPEATTSRISMGFPLSARPPKSHDAIEYHYLALVFEDNVAKDLLRDDNPSMPLASIRKAFENNFSRDVADQEFCSRRTSAKSGP